MTQTSRLRRLGLPALALLSMLAPGLACKRSEKPAAGAPASPAPAAAAATPAPAPDTPPVIHETAEAGKAPWADLAEPRGAALDGRGRIWVSDFGHSRIAIFDLSGGYLGGWGGVKGNGKFQLQDPGDVAIHGGDVYVADTWNGRVQQFTTSGQFRETSVTELYGPRGVVVAPDGVVWIADPQQSPRPAREGPAQALPRQVRRRPRRALVPGRRGGERLARLRGRHRQSPDPGARAGREVPESRSGSRPGRRPWSRTSRWTTRTTSSSPSPPEAPCSSSTTRERSSTRGRRTTAARSS